MKFTTLVKDQIEFLESEQISSIAAGSKNDRTESTCARASTDIISNLIGYSPYLGAVESDTEKFFRSLHGTGVYTYTMNHVCVHTRIDT